MKKRGRQQGVPETGADNFLPAEDHTAATRPQDR